MRKVIAGINMTLDGICDHTVMIADDELHEHYNEVLLNADTLVYGRITYQLMESYWPSVVKNPTGNKPTDEFAVLMENMNKLVFSHTLNSVDWHKAKLATGSIEEEIMALKQQPGKDILVGSPSLITAVLNLGLADEFQICVQPIIEGKGLSLLKNITDRIDLKLLRTKTLASSGSVVFYYALKKK